MGDTVIGIGISLMETAILHALAPGPTPPTSTVTAVEASANPVVVGNPVTLTATVTPGDGSGTVQFKSDGANLGAPVNLIAGAAAYETSALAVGTHAITAVYSGNGSHSGSSGTLAGGLAITKVPTTTGLGSSANPRELGREVTFTATVAPSAANGTVQFKDGAANLGAPVTVVGGVAAYATAALGPGSHSITAVYSGDATYAGSSSSALDQVISDYQTLYPASSRTLRTEGGYSGIISWPATQTAAEAHDGSDGSYDHLRAAGNEWDEPGECTRGLTWAHDSCSYAGSISKLRVRLKAQRAGNESGDWLCDLMAYFQEAHQGTAQTPAASFGWLEFEFTVNPATGQPWTQSAINATSFGWLCHLLSIDENNDFEVYVSECQLRVYG